VPEHGGEGLVETKGDEIGEELGGPAIIFQKSTP
jgi:hypothetical protein